MNQVQNQVTLIGYLGKDPETIGKGENTGATFDLATREVFRSGEGRKDRTDWHRIVCWQGVARTCQHLAKGDRVAIFGKLRTNTWKDADGNARRAVEVHASDVHFIQVKAFAEGDADA